VRPSYRVLALGAVLSVLGTLVLAPGSAAQPGGADKNALSLLPKGYVCLRATVPPRLDGRLDEAAWDAAAWSDPFVDIVGAGQPGPPLQTRFKLLWDDEYLYIGAYLEEPHVRARAEARDDYIHRIDSNFEVFLDPDGDSAEYAELQVNAIGTIFDLALSRPYKDDGLVLINWDMKGLRVAVHVDGTINDAHDVDTGWSVEIAIPWRPDMKDFAGKAVPPRDGDRWRVNFSRVQWPDRVEGGGYVRAPEAREDNWVWSPQGVVNMHRPETWGVVLFRDRPAGVDSTEVATPVDPAQAARALLYRIYYAQREHQERLGRCAATLADLGLEQSELMREGERLAGLASAIGAPVPGSLSLAATENAYEASVEVRVGGEVQRWHVREDSRFWRSR